MKHVSVTSDIKPLINAATQAKRKLISFDAYSVANFFPSNSNWWMGFIALNDTGDYGVMITFSFFDDAIYKCYWSGSTDKTDWAKIN